MTAETADRKPRQQPAREKLLNAPALLIMGAVIVVALWVLFPRQPAFRNPANLSAKDALSVAYLRVLVQSDSDNAPLRLSLVQVLTEAGLLDEARGVIEPLQLIEREPLRFEIRLADLKLSLQQLYRRPSEERQQTLRQQIADLISRLLLTAPNESALDQVATLAEQFGEPQVLAQTFEHLAITVPAEPARKASWWRLAGRHYLAANAPKHAAQSYAGAFLLEPSSELKQTLAKNTLRALLQAGLDENALALTLRIMAGVTPDTELYQLAADIAEPLGDEQNALRWLTAVHQAVPEPNLTERLLRLRIATGDLAGALELAPLLRDHVQPGSERHRLLAHIYDWNSQSRPALEMWLSLAMTGPDPEAESRAFALARDLPEDAAIMQLIELLATRRELTEPEWAAYIEAGLRQVEPLHLEQELRRHLLQFADSVTAKRTLSRLLVRMGEPDEALAALHGADIVDTIQAELRLARTLDAAGEPERALDVLLRRFSAPPEQETENYWLLLADLAWQLGRDTYASKALAEALVYRPDDATIVDRLQQLARRNRDDRELERLARYGWERLDRISDLQRLMRFAFQRKNWVELDRWLALAEARPEQVQQAPDYWMYSAVRKMAAGNRDAARKALKETLRLRGQDPEVSEAIIWLLLAEPNVDATALEAAVQGYRQQGTVSPPLAEALAAAELTLGRPQSAAGWFMQSLQARPKDFFWNLTLADNVEWVGCPAHANAIRLQVLRSIGQGGVITQNGQHPARLADYFYGVHDPKVVSLDEDEVEVWQDLRSGWNIVKPLDNARFFALMRQRERLLLSAWEDFADAVRENRMPIVQQMINAVAQSLASQPAGPAVSGTLPLTLDDVDRANRWFAGSAPVNTSTLASELPICRESLAAIHVALNTRSKQEPTTP